MVSGQSVTFDPERKKKSLGSLIERTQNSPLSWKNTSQVSYSHFLEMVYYKSIKWRRALERKKSDS